MGFFSKKQVKVLKWAAVVAVIVAGLIILL